MPRWPDFAASADGLQRCGWCGDDPLYIRYHDEEWGVPVTEDRRLFEFLLLEGAQAGLSWITILRKRQAYRRAFADFDPRKVAAFGAADVRRLLKDKGIVRNRLKIESAISNARAFLAVQRDFGSFAYYAWSFTGFHSLARRPASMRQVPSRSKESDAWSKDMQRRNFRFCGSTILYAHMQATGMVNDHLRGCFRARQIGAFKFLESSTGGRSGRQCAPSTRPVRATICPLGSGPLKRDG